MYFIKKYDCIIYLNNNVNYVNNNVNYAKEGGFLFCRQTSHATQGLFLHLFTQVHSISKGRNSFRVLIDIVGG